MHGVNSTAVQKKKHETFITYLYILREASELDLQALGFKEQTQHILRKPSAASIEK